MPKDCTRDVDAVLAQETDSMIPHYADEVTRIVHLIRQLLESRAVDATYDHQDIRRLLNAAMGGRRRLEHG